MYIELIGCTSSGKSTLIKKMIQSCHDQGIVAFTGDQFVLEQIKLNWIKSYALRTIAIDFTTLFACILTIRSNFKFYYFVRKVVQKLPLTVSIFEKLNIIRNTLKKIGELEIIRFRDSDNHIIFLDEGTLHTAHYLFVQQSAKPALKYLPIFLNLIPYPDVIIYLKEHEDIIVERTLRRSHRRIKDPSYTTITKFITHAVYLFSRMEKHQAVRDKLIIVNKSSEVKSISSTNESGPIKIALNLLHNTIYKISHNKKIENNAKNITTEHRVYS